MTAPFSPEPDELPLRPAISAAFGVIIIVSPFCWFFWDLELSFLNGLVLGVLSVVVGTGIFCLLLQIAIALEPKMSIVEFKIFKYFDPDHRKVGFWRRLKHRREERQCSDPVDLWLDVEPHELRRLRRYLPPVERYVDRRILHDAYARLTKDMGAREQLTRQAAASIAAEADQKTAELMRAFLDRLPVEERALLGLRLIAESRATRDLGGLEREITKQGGFLVPRRHDGRGMAR